MSGERTLVLNSSYHVVGILKWQDAISHLYEGDAEMLHEWHTDTEEFTPIAYDREVANSNRKYVWKIPAIIRLLDSNVMPKHRAVKYSKINVFYRDDYTCQYCGFKAEHGVVVNKKKKITIDHVHPQSLGGKTNFENCVAACSECNSKKGDKTLAEVGFKLLRKPVVPTNSSLQKRKMTKKKVHPSWEKYLNASFVAV